MVTDKTIEDILLELKLVSQEQLNDLRKESREKNTEVERLLIEKKIITSEILTKAKAIVLKVPYVDLKKIQIPEEIQNIIPEQAALKYKMVVFYQREDVVGVALVDPTDFRALDYVRARTGAKIEPYIANPEDIEGVLGSYSRFDRSIGAVLDSVKETTEGVEDIFRLSREVSLEPGKMQADSTPVVQLVNNIFDFAIKNKASDIHIEPLPRETRVRCRIDGMLQELTLFPTSVHPAIISRIKIMSNLKIDEKRVPQDGRISLKVANKEYDLRVSTLPTIHNEKIVIRILSKTDRILALEELGFRGKALTLTKEYFKRTNGMFLSTGPTGSGKSTTLYSALRMVSTPAVNVITLEDPVEHVIDGVNQTQVNVAAGLTFGTGLRSIVRQDPDIIMVGEIRDLETASLAVNASLTGHLVFSTLHTNNAASGITRLIDIGVEPFLVASTVNIIIAQRLVRKICTECREEIKPSQAILEKIQEETPFVFENSQQRQEILSPYPNASAILAGAAIKIYQGRGCNVCRGDGYKGRIGIFEVMEVTETIQDLAIQKASEKDIQYASIADGMLTLVQEGMLKMLDGITTLEEVLRVAA